MPDDDDEEVDDDDDADESDLDSDDVGAIGQRAFELWCAQRKIVALVAGRDKHGWDYLLQWAVPSDDPLAPPEMTCKVQVKTTRTQRRSSAIKLSNWARMAKETTPWFIAGIRLDDSEPRDVHLVPVDERLVARTYKRLARVSDKEELHCKKMQVTWMARHRLGEPFHDALYRGLHEHIGQSQSKYEAQKQLWKQRAHEALHKSAAAEQQGSESAAPPTLMPIADVTGTFYISAKNEDDLFDRITQMAVGVISEIPVEKFLPDKDVELPPDFDPLDVKLVTVPRERDFEATMTFYDRDRSQQVTLVRDVLGSQRVAIARSLPQRFQRWRFTGPLVTFVYRFGDDDHPASFSAQWDLRDVKDVSLDALGRVARLARMFGAASQRGLVVRVTLPDGKAFEIDLSAVPEGAEPDFLERMRTAEDAAALARYFDLDAAAMAVNPEALHRYQFPLRLFAAAIDRAVADLGVTVVIEPHEPVDGKRAAVILTSVVPLADRVLAGIFFFVGRATWTPMTDTSGTMGVADAQFRIDRTAVMRREDWNAGKFRERVDELTAQLKAEGIDVVARAQ